MGSLTLCLYRSFPAGPRSRSEASFLCVTGCSCVRPCLYQCNLHLHSRRPGATVATYANDLGGWSHINAGCSNFTQKRRKSNFSENVLLSPPPVGVQLMIRCHRYKIVNLFRPLLHALFVLNLSPSFSLVAIATNAAAAAAATLLMAARHVSLKYYC